MHRLIRLVAALTATIMIVAGAGIQPAAAQSDDNGVTSDTTYESPQYGYEVEWTSDWEVIEEVTLSGASSDVLRIFYDDGVFWLDIVGFDIRGREPDDFLESYIDQLSDLDSYEDVEWEQQDSDDRDAAAALLTYELGENALPIESYLEVRIVDDALVLTAVIASSGEGLSSAAIAQDDVELEGDPIFPSLASDTSDNDDERDDDDERERSGLDGDTYVAPTFGVTFDIDARDWEVIEDLAADDNGGRDLLLIDHVDTPIRIYFETYDTITRARSCLNSASEEAYGDADVNPFEDEDGEEIEGSSREAAYAAYLYELSNGDDGVAYVECRTLPDSAGVFVITMFTLPDDWADAFDLLLDILDTVDLEGGSAGDERTLDGDIRVSERDDDDRDDGEIAHYESPTYGFVIAYDADLWAVTGEWSRRGTDRVELETIDDVTVAITAMEAGRRDTAQSCVEDFLDDLDADLIDVVDDDDEPVRGKTDFGFYYAVVAYDNDEDDRFALFAECGASPDGDYLVLFVGESPWDLTNDMLSGAIAIIEAMEF